MYKICAWVIPLLILLEEKMMTLVWCLLKGNHSSFLPFITCSTLNRDLEMLVFTVAVQWLNHVRLFVTPWTAACQASLFFTISQSLLRFLSTESVMLLTNLILCCPLLLLPSIFPSIRVFSNRCVVLSYSFHL